ncbi:hypothetical protein BHK98_09870 [Hornefia porci]|uniref:Biotin carboxyl carrier protein of acetyl-CoA carboxylase n=1 Tax=Hornefia porci TaxID=2652292 RepID=A0A1Q9JJL0_9FIRM|nr:biotin/lipoyl-containing protein [Hornefia porci]OLR56345.1 hypothetical protein BHK98_09870 [Hornefia porci]
MEKKEIFDLIKKFERSELTALEYETDGERLRLEKTEKKDENIEKLLSQLLPLVTAGARAGSGAGVSMFCADAAENDSGFGVSPSVGGLQTAAAAPSPGASLKSSPMLNPDASPVSDLPREAGSPGISPETVKAPLVGIFYRAAAPGAKPFVEIGDTVRKGEVMCIIEAMKVMNEIKAPCDLTVTKVLGVDGELVDCGRTLFEVEKC